jgi:hypothetical protein
MRSPLNFSLVTKTWRSPMRRGFALFVAAALGCMTPVAFGQYNPYPYAPQPYHGPTPVQYVPSQYGYPPVYYPATMMRPSPQQYPQYPQYPRSFPPRVHYFGPLTEGSDSSPPVHNATLPPAISTQPTGPAANVKPLPTLSGANMLPESCGAGCTDPLMCGPTCEVPCAQRYKGRGHFIGETGAFFLVPVRAGDISFANVTGTTTTTGDFPDIMHFGPRLSVGYVCHNGWGVRAGYWYLEGDQDATTTNADPNAVVVTPGAAGFSIASVSPSLAAGLGTDQFALSQGLDLHIADLEIVRETSVMHTSLLFGVGVRYGRIRQNLFAERTNLGGTAGDTVFALDRATSNATSRFAGFGPTTSVDFVHPLTRWGLGLYGNIRGSWLIGTNRFGQTLTTEQRSIVGGIDNNLSTVNGTVAYDHRNVSMLETELGLQLGCRVRGCYVFTRVGAAYQHWWDVGAPASANGDLRFYGGTAMLGITY